VMSSLADRRDGAEPAEAAAGIARADATAVNAATNRSLYAKREQVYPKSVTGTWRTLKWGVMIALLAIYYITPFLQWPRAGGAPDQAILVDFGASRIYLGPLTIWPQEIHLITGVLVASALGLFLATALFGRIWCGYACPQTVWTDLYIAVESWIEGDRNQRIRLDRAPWSAEKVFKKGAKHLIWLAIALATGGWFVAYFHDAGELARTFFTGQAPMTAYLFAGLLTATTYTLAGTMREQVCTYMCPWPRIQAAMMDREALSVTYRAYRGEERGPHKAGQSWEGRGDCIDCRQCVAVCPAGIDIRDGMQIECINCALCVDACDAIMTKIDRPKGLIAWDNAVGLEAGAKGEKTRYRLIRGRTVFYAFALLVVAGVMGWTVLSKTDATLDVLRDRAPLFVQLSDGSVRNAYTVKLFNKDTVSRTFVIGLEGLDGAEVSAVGHPDGQPITVTLGPDSPASVRMLVKTDPAEVAARSVPVRVIATEQGAPQGETGEQLITHSVFIRGND
jgi:cytochrome c oxidase accessory protein FixG